MDTKSRIMETAFKLFLKNGFADVSLNEIIRESDITTGGFYYHFDSKDTLLVEVIKKYIFNYFSSVIEQIKDFEGTPEEKFRTVILNIVGDDSTINETTQLVESAEKIDYRVLHLLLFEGVQKYDIIAEHYTAFYYDLLDFNKEVINEGIAQEVIRDDMDITELALLVQTVMVGTVIMWIGMPAMPMAERMEDNMHNLWNFIKKEDKKIS
ncbi:TetR/AcrR family transcriptional regulator [uncultured Methanobacterium sp.]|uniref:TetR/AcrR family transcriptional regulator n=1 Tax=uncultured Methanobacterium sp. TaxID=176306 RepID=UPI002AA82E7B|nr:TetR/AcrR family transcriptional regulator [uncultured Methanobacterium sp.]